MFGQRLDMARRPRLEFEGAIYHVFNRVNPGCDVFGGPDAAKLFEECLLEARAEHGWRLHAYCVVRESFHVAIETPRANLVSGMHWFQSTFAKRLRDMNGTRGPLFQGRYRALLVEKGAPLANLASYIHLRPAETGVVSPEQLHLFRWSSLRRILRRDCPDYLAPSAWIDHVRELSGALDKTAAYGVLISRLARDPNDSIAIGMRGMTRGPVIGSRGFRAALVEHSSPHAGEETWHETLDTLLDTNGKSRGDVESDAKGAPWKVDLALALRNRAGAPLEWIARELGMGTVNSVSHHLWLARKSMRELQSA